jgi:hypothetical protein
MPNILFTQRCVRSCPYCFARKHMSDSSPDDVISWENLIYIADFLEHSGERNFSILGGEPTLHPQFLDMVLYLMERKFMVRIFTSGIMAEKSLLDMRDALAGLPGDNPSFICNLNDPRHTDTPASETARVERFLSLMGPRVAPGFNIYHENFQLDFILHYINQYALKRSIRLGLAHPIPGKQNMFVPLDRVDRVIARLFEYAPLMQRLKVAPGLDCGFPRCHFTDEQLLWLHTYGSGDMRFGCGPVIDIGPDMSVWQCFPLSAYHKRSLFEFDTLREAFDYYDRITSKIRMESSGVFAACDTCEHRFAKRCSAGCLAHMLNAFQSEPRIRVEEVYA